MYRCYYITLTTTDIFACRRTFTVTWWARTPGEAARIVRMQMRHKRSQKALRLRVRDSKWREVYRWKLED